MKVRIVVSHSDDPYINLAAEDRLFRTMDEDERILYLWRNRDAVIMGRYQNPYLECNLPLMRRDGVLLVRRQSGGGTVYHDRGNTNFTFITSRDDFDKEKTTRIVTRALRESFGIVAAPAGRNDIHVEGKKISGSAFKLTSKLAFHHGTLLIDADLTRLSRYLRPEAMNIESKSTRSIRSEVINLIIYNRDIEHGKVCSALEAAVSREWGGSVETMELEEGELLSLDGCARSADELKNWSWIFGKTPPFSAVFEESFDVGTIAVTCHVRNGFFEEVTISGGPVSPELGAGFSRVLTGSPCEPHSIREKKRDLEELDYLFDRLASRF